MDITKIASFMQYTPILDQEPRSYFLEVIKDLKLSDDERKLLHDTFDYASSFHSDTKRLSGELYIIHPIKVLEFLLTVQPDIASMQAALLHDLIEDTSVTYNDVETAFGTEVADLCDGLVKVSKVRYRGEDRQIETLKKTFLAMGKDLRVIIVKIADRVHNIQTLHYHPKKEKRQRIAEETLKVYVPIAKRLGLYIYQGFLENGAFFQLEPREYNRIYRHVIKQYGDVDKYKASGIERLELLCESEEIPFTHVTGRLKSPYRIHKKLKKNQNDITRIMDVLAFRIITKEVTDCYSILGLIHKYYTPIFSKMKDYIAIPKSNGYKSLHTTVLGMFEFPVEIQVRTQEMDDIANYGVAAHFAYAETEQSITVSQAQSQWIKKLQDIVTKYQENPDKDSFKHELDIEILQKNIFVYTPKGDIIELPTGSTVLDFAFRVHTDIGLKFKNGFINGKIVPIDYQLKTGDIVAINTFKNKFTASEGRARFLHTPTAKTKLQRRLRLKEKDQLFKELGAKINKKLVSFDLPTLGSKQDRITRQFNGSSYEQLLYRIRDKQLSITRLIRDTYPDLLNEEQLQTLPDIKNTVDTTQANLLYNVIIDGNDIEDIVFCPECTPSLKDKIIGRTGKDGIKIHTLACPALQTIEPRKLLEAHWKGGKTASYTLKLEIDGIDKPGVLLETLSVFNHLGVNVLGLKTGKSNEKGYATMYIDLAFDHPSKIGFVLKELKKRAALKVLGKKIS